jgi:hypothetical protein
MAACADGEAAERISDDLDVVDVAVDGTAGVTATDPGIFDQITAQTCDTEFKTITLAVEAFTAMNGQPPQNEDELIGTFLRSAVIGFDLSPEGVVIPATDSPCA